ncbi:MAG: alpha/beta hydrolase-fold protein [Gemmatimonadaceae bacterium]|nr:alpha/beta hydrolase-fold protein [Gemmatimonadaceae bacterium]
MLRSLLRACLLLTVTAARSGDAQLPHGTVEHRRFRAPSLGVQKNMLVYLPPSYVATAGAARRYPVALYLHGRWGDETDWVTLGRLPQVMDSLVASGMPEMIVVMPDGDDGWWMTWALPQRRDACRREPHRDEAPDEYCVPTPRYDEYVVHDVVSYVDSAYRTIAQRDARAIGGLSMGGYGAISLAMRYPEMFVAAASHSGVLVPGLMPDSSSIPTVGRITWRAGRSRSELREATHARWAGMYPMFGFDSSTWRRRDPLTLLAALRAAGRPVPALYADVGRRDELVQQNRTFVEQSRRLDVAIEYAEWDGDHSWATYQRNLGHGLRFLSRHLTRAPAVAGITPIVN